MIGDPDAGDLLCANLVREADREPYLCTSIVAAIKQIRPESSVATLCSFLRSGNGRVARRDAAELLGELDDVSAIETLAVLLFDSDSGLRQVVLSSLKRLCMKSKEKSLEVMKKLEELTASDDDPVIKAHAQEVFDAIHEQWKERRTTIDDWRRLLARASRPEVQRRAIDAVRGLCMESREIVRQAIKTLEEVADKSSTDDSVRERARAVSEELRRHFLME
jgi:HEAT repeat protein